MMFRLVLASLALTSLSLGASASASGACKGFNSAHCHCRATADSQSLGDAPANLQNRLVLPAGTVLFTYTIPNKCFNPQIEYLSAHFGKGCWKACRDAVGVDGVTPDPGLSAARTAASKWLRAKGACGGWYNAVYEFSSGTNKFRSATANTIGLGIGGSLHTDPRTGAKTCR